MMHHTYGCTYNMNLPFSPLLMQFLLLSLRNICIVHTCLDHTLA